MEYILLDAIVLLVVDLVMLVVATCVLRHVLVRQERLNRTLSSLQNEVCDAEQRTLLSTRPRNGRKATRQQRKRRRKLMKRYKRRQRRLRPRGPKPHHPYARW